MPYGLMTPKCAAVLAVACLLGTAGAEEPPVVGPPSGSLVIMGGGGKEVPGVFGACVELAGGKQARIVIVPTAASSNPAYPYQRSWAARMAKERFEVAEVTVLRTHDRRLSPDPGRAGNPQGARAWRRPRRVLGRCNHPGVLSRAGGYEREHDHDR